MSPPGSVSYQYPDAFSRNFTDSVNQAVKPKSADKEPILHDEYAEAPVSAQPTERSQRSQERPSIESGRMRSITGPIAVIDNVDAEEDKRE